MLAGCRKSRGCSPWRSGAACRSCPFQFRIGQKLHRRAIRYTSLPLGCDQPGSSRLFWCARCICHHGLGLGGRFSRRGLIGFEDRFCWFQTCQPTIMANMTMRKWKSGSRCLRHGPGVFPPQPFRWGCMALIGSPGEFLFSRRRWGAALSERRRSKGGCRSRPKAYKHHWHHHTRETTAERVVRQLLPRRWRRLVRGRRVGVV